VVPSGLLLLLLLMFDNVQFILHVLVLLMIALNIAPVLLFSL
jgi:hypothetical protein